MVKVPDRLVTALGDIVGSKNVSTAMAIREQHGKDESYHRFLETWNCFVICAIKYWIQLFEKKNWQLIDWLNGA